MNFRLNGFRKEADMLEQAIMCEAGDERARLIEISARIHREIILATNMAEDGRDIEHVLDRIEGMFESLAKVPAGGHKIRRNDDDDEDVFPAPRRTKKRKS